MNNIGPALPDLDTGAILRAADALIATVRKHGGDHGQLDIESKGGEKWRITIERIKDSEARQ